MPFIPPEWGQTGKPGTSSLQEMDLVEAIDQLVGLGSMGSIDPSSMANPMAGPFGKIIAKGPMSLPALSLPITLRRAIRSIPRHLRELLTKGKGKPLQIGDQLPPQFQMGAGSYSEYPSFNQIMVDPEMQTRTAGSAFGILRHELEHGLRWGGGREIPQAFLEEAAPLAREGGKGVVNRLHKAGYAKIGGTVDELAALAAEESATRGIFPGSAAAGDFPRVPQELGDIYKNILRMENKQLRALHKAKGKLRRPR